MRSEFRVFVRLSSDNPTHRRSLGTFDAIDQAEEAARKQDGAYVEPWHPNGKIMLCAGRFAPGIYRPESEGSRAQAERFVLEAVGRK